MSDLAASLERMQSESRIRVVFTQKGEDWFFYTTSQEWAEIWAEKSSGKIEVYVYGVGWIPQTQPMNN